VSAFGKFGEMTRQICVEAKRNSDFLGNSTENYGIDGGGVVEDTSKSAIGIPILKLLMGIERGLSGKLLTINALDMNITRAKLSKDPDCKVCNNQPE
jgi:hypothetical protein